MAWTLKAPPSIHHLLEASNPIFASFSSVCVPTAPKVKKASSPIPYYNLHNVSGQAIQNFYTSQTWSVGVIFPCRWSCCLVGPISYLGESSLVRWTQPCKWTKTHQLLRDKLIASWLPLLPLMWTGLQRERIRGMSGIRGYAVCLIKPTVAQHLHLHFAAGMWEKSGRGGGRVCKAVSKGEQSLVVRGVSLTSVQEGSDIPPPFSGVDESWKKCAVEL